MTLLQGDTTGISVPDLLQSFEGNQRTGTLSLRSGEFSARIHFRGGKVASFACDGRPSLGETLVRTGTITARQLQGALSRRGRSKKPLVEFLGRTVDEQKLREAAQAALFEDVCDAIAGLNGSFTFADGEPPADAFDSDELAMELALAAGPLLLEAARRADHHALARETIPSDTVHFVAAEGAEPPPDIEDPDLAHSLLDALDGTRSVREVLAYHPTHRFVAFQVLAKLVEAGLARAATTDELVRVAESLASVEPKRARAVLARGLAAQPHHAGMLQLEARLAEAAEDPVGATNALKVIAHLALAAGEPAEAQKALLRAKRLLPTDTAVREKLLALALEQRRSDAVLQEGLELAALYREPGLHGKACEVLQRLVKFAPDAFELQKELAATLADAGRAEDAIMGLQKLAKILIAKGRELAARDLLTAVLTIDPKHGEAKRTIAAIDAQAFARRRDRRKRLQRLLLLGLVVTLLGVGITFEVRARVDLVNTISRIDTDQLIENSEYELALGLYQAVAARHPMTLTTWFDIRQRIRDLEAKAVLRAPAGGSANGKGSGAAAPAGSKPRRDAGPGTAPVPDGKTGREPSGRANPAEPRTPTKPQR